MKIGIVTLCRVRNYGACLQAYAMKHVLQMQGHEVYFLKAYDKEFAKELLHNDLGKIRPWHIPYLLSKEVKYRKFFKNFTELGMDQLKELDCVLIGSDSVWIYKYRNMRTPSTFFGLFDHGNISAYAPSVGGTYDISNYSERQLAGLKKLKHITVRDEMTVKFVREVLGVDASLVVDPTLLIDWGSVLDSELGKFKQRYGNYILLYGGFDSEVIHSIKEYAVARNLQIVNVGGFNWRVKNNPVVNPLEFVDLIRDSAFVLTSMFHGVMLSIALNKKFRYIAIDPQRGIKISTIIDQLNLKECIVDRQSFLNNPTIIDLEISEKRTRELLCSRRKESLMELDKCLYEMEE